MKKGNESTPSWPDPFPFFISILHIARPLLTDRDDAYVSYVPYVLPAVPGGRTQNPASTQLAPRRAARSTLFGVGIALATTSPRSCRPRQSA